jgi:Mrp family chromosome partitioning ATPase
MAYLAEFGDLIGDLADGYDDIVVHLPPLLDTPEATGLLARADHTVLAVAWGRTPRQLVQGVVAETPGLRGPGAGVVLSRVALNRLSRYGVIRPRRNGWNSGRGTAKST